MMKEFLKNLNQINLKIQNTIKLEKIIQYKNERKTKDKIKVIQFTLYIKGDESMIKNLAWNTFKNTGNIDTFMEMIEVENIEKNIEKNIIEKEQIKNGNYKDKSNSYSRTQYE